MSDHLLESKPRSQEHEITPQTVSNTSFGVVAVFRFKKLSNCANLLNI